MDTFFSLQSLGKDGWFHRKECPWFCQKSVVIRFLSYENSLPSSWNTPASSTIFESPRIIPKHLARQEIAKSAPDTSWQPDSNKSLLSPCSYLMSDHHGFPQTGARRWAVFLGVLSFHLACLTSLLTGHEMRGQMALNALSRWMAGVQVCWGVGRRWGEAGHSIAGVYQKEQFQLGSVSSWEPEWLMLWTASAVPAAWRAQEKWTRASLMMPFLICLLRAWEERKGTVCVGKNTVLQVRGPIFFSIFNVWIVLKFACKAMGFVMIFSYRLWSSWLTSTSLFWPSVPILQSLPTPP